MGVSNCMIDSEEYLDDLLIMESSFTRLLHHLDKSEAVIISACRKDYNTGKDNLGRGNVKRSYDLKHQLQDLGYGPVRVKGHYVETDEPTKQVDAPEISWFVVNKGNPNFKKQMIKLGYQYHQDSIYYTKDGKSVYIATSPDHPDTVGKIIADSNGRKVGRESSMEGEMGDDNTFRKGWTSYNKKRSKKDTDQLSFQDKMNWY